ncbi:hypothetical protein BU14_0457s0015, partial [Porphyra umbilicalis]
MTIRHGAARVVRHLPVARILPARGWRPASLVGARRLSSASSAIPSIAPLAVSLSLTHTSWFCLPEQGMTHPEYLCAGTAFLTPLPPPRPPKAAADSGNGRGRPPSAVPSPPPSAMTVPPPGWWRSRPLTWRRRTASAATTRSRGWSTSPTGRSHTRWRPSRRAVAVAWPARRTAGPPTRPPSRRAPCASRRRPPFGMCPSTWPRFCSTGTKSRRCAAVSRCCRSALRRWGTASSLPGGDAAARGGTRGAGRRG